MDAPITHDTSRPPGDEEIIQNLLDPSTLLAFLPNPGANLLDFGCGSGKITSDYLGPIGQKLGGYVIGLDISEQMIEFANNNYKRNGLEFICGDIASPSFNGKIQANSLDLIFSSYALNWVEDIKSAMSIFHTFLKPGGQLRFVLTSKALIEPLHQWLAQDTKWKSIVQLNNRPIPPWSKSGISALEYFQTVIPQIGFKTLELRELERTSIFKPAKEKFPHFYSTLVMENLEHLLSQHPEILSDVWSFLESSTNTKYIREDDTIYENISTLVCILSKN